MYVFYLQGPVLSVLYYKGYLLTEGRDSISSVVSLYMSTQATLL